MNLNAGEASGLYCRGTHAEAAYDVFYLSNCECNRLAELSTGQPHLYRRRGLWVGVDDLLGLSPGMADLCPEMIAVAGCCFGPTRKCSVHYCIRLLIYDDVARAFQMIAIHQYVTGQKQPRAAVTPQAIQSF